MPVDTYRLSVKFPLGKTFAAVQSADKDTLEKLPGTTKKHSLLKVTLKEGSHANVDGYGMPFANPGHASEGWVNRNAPMIGKHTLLDILERSEFSFVVASGDMVLETKWAEDQLPPPFRYPYGTEHTWSMDRYHVQLPENKGPQFAAAWRFEDDNEHLAALTQSQAQDIVWVANAADKIRGTIFRAYFVVIGSAAPADATRFYVVLPAGREFLEENETAWRRLSNSEVFKVDLYDEGEDDGPKGPARWDAKLVDNPSVMDELSAHPVDKHDIVLVVRRPRKEEPDRRPNFEVKVFGARTEANRALQEDKTR